MKSINIKDNGKVKGLLLGLGGDRSVKVRGKKGDKPGEDVVWVDEGEKGPWTVTFDKKHKGKVTGSPFSADHYTIPQGLSKATEGGPKEGAKGKYYYNVRKGDSPRGDIIDDPDVDIEG